MEVFRSAFIIAFSLKRASRSRTGVGSPGSDGARLSKRQGSSQTNSLPQGRARTYCLISLDSCGNSYATNAGGTWTLVAQRRITTVLGPTSLVVDVATGRVHVLLAGDFGVR